MASSTTTAIGVNDTDAVVGDDLNGQVVADATADSKATTVDGIATALADVQAGVGVLDSTITVGGDASQKIVETGVATAAATSVSELAGAQAIFSGETGGFIDTASATDVDFTAGGLANLDVQVGNTATATANTISADATATGLIDESYGLKDIGVRVGSDGTLSANVDADVASTATTTGLPGVPAAAQAFADAIRVAAISGLGDGQDGASSDFSFGDDATITANAGTSGDRVTLSASATTVGGTGDGDATALAGSASIAGITASAGTDGAVSDVLSVGADATITARAYVDATAKAVTVAGDAQAGTTLQEVDGIQADSIVIGQDASIKAFASTLSSSSATSTAQSATAVTSLDDSRAIQLDNLTIGDSATAAAGYGVIGSASASLLSTAVTSGDVTLESADATSSSGRLIGVQFGDGDDTSIDLGLSAGADLSLAGLADLSAAASATAIDGGARAISQSFEQVSGVVLDEAGASSIGAGGKIQATANVNLDATATNVGSGTGFDPAEAIATTNLVQGLGQVGWDTSLTIGDGGVITAAASVAADAAALSVAENARSVAGGGDAYGIKSERSDLTIGAAGTLNANSSSAIGARAVSTAGAAEAQATTSESTGLYSADLSIGNGGTINAGADTSDKANATSVAGSAEAVANAGTNVGFEAVGSVSVGAAGTINTSAALLLQAFADSIGDDSDDDLVVAAANSVDNIGFLADQANTSIGAGGSVIATASLTANAVATGVQADVSGESTAVNNVGLDLFDGNNARTLSVGAAGTVTGSATGNTSSTARTTDGDASANTDVNLTAGLGDGDGVVSVGANAVVSGTASSTSSATAAAIQADGDSFAPLSDVDARVSNDLVSGIDLGILDAGANAAITATAVSSQSATASNIGRINAGDDATVTASVAAGNAITGLDSTTVTVGGDLSGFNVGAQLTGSATSANLNATGDSTAAAGLGAAVIGMDDSDLDLGDDALAASGLRVDAISNLAATASGVAGAALATAGDGASTVIAINSSDLTVGNNANTTAVAASNVAATASSIAADANAAASQQADGLRDSAIAIGNDGNVIGQATLVGNAKATTVGDPVLAAGAADANASVSLLASGIDQGIGDTIVIGDTGNVSGNGFANGASMALTTTGNAFASGDLQVEGIDLSSDGSSDITIQGTGNITGLAVIGTLAGGNLGEQVSVSATTTNGTAEAVGDFDGFGIEGLDDLAPLYLDPTLLIAGPVRGDVSGQVVAGGRVQAASIGDSRADTATATNALSELYGLQNVDIQAGQFNSSLVKGTAYGDFDVTATSVAGDTQATSNTNVYGIFDGAANGNITLSGGVSAIAQLTNNATTNSVGGSATSNAAGAAAALYGYDVTIIGSGSLGATAISNTGSVAHSVAGNASA